jgi:hypothetical protein
LNPDHVVATVQLFPTDAGGRRGPTPADIFNCLMLIDNEVFSVRLYLDGVGSILPGQTARVLIRFLYPERARQYCAVGKMFNLREISAIGDGVIEEVYFP